MNLETQSLGNKSPPERVVVYFYNGGGVDDFLLGTRDRIRTCKSLTTQSLGKNLRIPLPPHGPALYPSVCR